MVGNDEKDRICDWFRTLEPPRRLDLMCGLLQMCLPIELRFIGAVLEDMAKKDYVYLRDGEIKANNPQDVSHNPSSSLSDDTFRGKLLLSLALMESTNIQCAEIIFSLLKKAEREIKIISRQYSGVRNNVTDEVELILTMATHHPALKFMQKLEISNTLKDFQENIDFSDDVCHLNGNAGSDDNRNVVQTKMASSGSSHLAAHPSQALTTAITQPEKVIIKAIEIKGIKESHTSNRKGGQEYQVHTLWSSGEITEVFMNFKALQHNLHYKLLEKFPEQKKQRVSIPVFPGLQSFQKQSDDKKIESLNSYFRELVKAPSNILNCDILVEAMRKGNVIQQTATPSCILLPRPYEDHFVHQQHPQVFQQHNFPQNYLSRLDRLSQVSSSHVMSSSQISSGTESPGGSRTSSPGTSIQYQPSHTSPGARPKASHQYNAHNQRTNELELTQLLRLLNMDKYHKNLRSYTVKQIMSMSKEDLAKQGLSKEAQDKLCTHRDQLKQNQAENFPELSSPTEHSSKVPGIKGPVVQVPFVGQAIYMPAFPPAQPPPQTHPPLLSQPTLQPQPPLPVQPVPSNQGPPAPVGVGVVEGDVGPAGNGSSAPNSPPQRTATASANCREPTISPRVSTNLGNAMSPLPMITPSAALSAVSPNIAFFNNDASSSFDASESEEEKEQGPEDVQQSKKGKSKSMPKQATSACASENGLIQDEELTPNAQNVISQTHMQQNLETPADVYPSVSLGLAAPPPAPAPVMPLVNGYSDPPPLIQPVRPLHRPYKNAQPTHTGPGMHKNIVNMPSYDSVSAMAVTMGKNIGGMLHSGGPALGFMAPPTAATTTAHQLVQPPLQSNNNNVVVQNATQLLEGGVAASYPYPTHAAPPMVLRAPIMNATRINNLVSNPSSNQAVGPPLSHSPSPVASNPPPGGDQITIFLQGSDERMGSGTPPSQPVAQVPHSVSKPPGAGTSGANTPSPPLAAAPPPMPPNGKPPASDAVPASTANHQQVYLQPFNGPYVFPFMAHTPQAPGNGLVSHMPPFFTSQGFPANGMTTNDYLLAAAAARMPHGQGQQMPNFLYGNNFTNHGPQALSHGSMQPPANGAHIHGNHPGQPQINSNGGKLVACYNCGNPGHKVSECKEATMEKLTKTYRLDYRPKSDSE